MSIISRECAETRASGNAPGRPSWSLKVEIVPIIGEWIKSDQEIMMKSISGVVNSTKPVACLSDYGKALWVSVYTGDSGEVPFGICPSCGKTINRSFSDSWKVEVCEIEYKVGRGYTFSFVQRLPLPDALLEVLPDACGFCLPIPVAVE